ncbi:MAG: hypothetical protein ACRDNI_13785 [Gaiellaceae bacterium]
MKRLHALAVAVLLGVVAVAGTFAALDTTSLGMAASEEASVSDAEIQARDKKLDRAERALRRAEKKRPPKLPALPARRSAPPAASPAAPPAPAATAVAVRREDDLAEVEVDDDFDHDDDTHTDGTTHGDTTDGDDDD